METLTTLAARFGARPNSLDLETHRLGKQAPDASLARLVLVYLAQFGARPNTLAQLAQAIDDLPDEEDLSASRCAEGVAVTSASDGWWVLFTEAGP